MILPSIFGSSSNAKISKLEQDVASLKSTKVDKVSGKGLSTNDFTDAYKSKLDGMDTISPVKPTVVASGDYVTPQMFGAKADGWSDDAEAIQKAIDSGKSVFFPHGDYSISKPIIITNKKFWTLHAEDALIGYTGTDFAIKVLHVQSCTINIGAIYTETGGGIKFYSDSEECWNQYVTLRFNAIMAKTDCICAETTGEGWSNENTVYGGRFESGENGVHLYRQNGVHGLTGWKFYNCGIEGVTNGFLFDAGNDEICNNVIVNPRYAESFETALITKGTVYDCKWIAPTPMRPEYIIASPETTRFMIDAPIGDFWHMHDTAYIRGVIMYGKLMGERPACVNV